VLEGAGVTPAELRQAAAARAAGLGGRPAGGPAGLDLPDDLLRFVDQVARRAVDVRREDVEALKRAGYSEDAIFEVMASSALGAALGRLERGMAALSGST
jgi:alkylhydroperoxidase family enzyme